ncbi:MAG: acetyl-CoA carboxylase biotin carboxyl carrier protein, partial [Lactococcus lactis]|nr:acetyl-CoA carboxylase biotin carboxyl carrier protein [Lactococcus lactis]
MENEELKSLIEQIDQSSLSYFDYQTDSHHLILSKEMPEIKSQKREEQLSSKTKMMEAVPTSAGEEKEEIIETTKEKAKEVIEKEGETIDSPMIGVAYLQANPDEEAYVKVGDRVEAGETICIIEAMKLMNEIQASKSGEVTEILIENEEVVEY